MNDQQQEVTIRTDIHAGDDGGMTMGGGQVTGGMMGGGGYTAPGNGTLGSGY